jgi:hypothetical protein
MFIPSRLENPDNQTLHPLPSWSFLWGLPRGIKRLVHAAKFVHLCCLAKSVASPSTRTDGNRTLPQMFYEAPKQREGYSPMPSLRTLS